MRQILGEHTPMSRSMSQGIDDALRAADKAIARVSAAVHRQTTVADSISLASTHSITIPNNHSTAIVHTEYDSSSSSSPSLHVLQQPLRASTSTTSLPTPRALGEDTEWADVLRTLRGVEQNLTQQQHHNTTLQAELALTQGQLHQATTRVATLEAALTNSNAALAKERGKRAQAASAQRVSTTAEASIAKKAAAHRAEVARLQEVVREQQRVVEGLKGRLGRAGQQERVMEERIQELQHTNARKEQELHAARCQLDDLRGRVEDMDTSIQHARTTLHAQHTHQLQQAQDTASTAQQHAHVAMAALRTCLTAMHINIPACLYIYEQHKQHVYDEEKQHGYDEQKHVYVEEQQQQHVWDTSAVHAAVQRGEQWCTAAVQQAGALEDTLQRTQAGDARCAVLQETLQEERRLREELQSVVEDAQRKASQVPLLQQQLSQAHAQHQQALQQLHDADVRHAQAHDMLRDLQEAAAVRDTRVEELGSQVQALMQEHQQAAAEAQKLLQDSRTQEDALAQEVQRLKTKLSASHTAHHALTTQLQHTQAAAVHHMCQWTQWVAQTLVKHIAHTLGQHVEDVGKHNTHTCGGEEDSTACRKEDSTACHVQCAGVTPAAPGCEASNGRNGDNDSAVPGGAVHHLSGDEICQQIRAQLHNVLCATCTNHDKGQLVNTDGQQDGIQHPTAAGAIDQPAHTHQVVHQVVDQNVDQVDAAAHALAAAITTIHTHMHTVAQKYSAHMRDHGNEVTIVQRLVAQLASLTSTDNAPHPTVDPATPHALLSYLQHAQTHVAQLVLRAEAWSCEEEQLHTDMHAQHALLTAAQQETQAALSALHTAREEASVTEEQLQEALQVAQEELVMVKQELVSVKKEHAEKKKDMLTLQSRMEVALQAAVAQRRQQEQEMTSMRQHITQLLHTAEAAHEEAQATLAAAKQEHQHKEDTLKKEATRLTTALTAAQEELQQAHAAVLGRQHRSSNHAPPSAHCRRGPRAPGVPSGHVTFLALLRDRKRIVLNKMQHLQAHLARAQRRGVVLRKQVESMRNEVQASSDKHKQVLTKLSSAQARAHKAETHVIRLQEQVHTLEHRAAKHSTTTQHAVAAQEKAQEKAQHLTRQLQSERAARQAAESQLTGACQQLERLREEYSHVVEQLASAQHELEHREVILMQQQQELTQLHQALQEAQLAQAVAEEELSAVQAAMDTVACEQGAHDETPTNLSQKTWHLPCPHRYMKLQLKFSAPSAKSSIEVPQVTFVSVLRRALLEAFGTQGVKEVTWTMLHYHAASHTAIIKLPAAAASRVWAACQTFDELDGQRVELYVVNSSPFLISLS